MKRMNGKKKEAKIQGKKRQNWQLLRKSKKRLFFWVYRPHKGSTAANRARKVG